MYYQKQNQGAEIYFCLLFLFSFFSISHSYVMNIEIFVKDFSGTALPRILKGLESISQCFGLIFLGNFIESYFFYLYSHIQHDTPCF